MSDSINKIKKSIQIIEQQLAEINQILGTTPIAQDGIVGKFDGEFMLEENGKKHQIPPNYASKSMLVVGDTVKMIEDPSGGQAKFKQIDKVERLKIEGVLARKDGKYEVLTEIGSFKVLPVSIKHYNGEPGDRVKIQIPKQYHKGGWAAVEKVYSADADSSTNHAPSAMLDPILAPQAAPKPVASTQPDNDHKLAYNQQKPEAKPEGSNQKPQNPGNQSKSKNVKKSKPTSRKTDEKPANQPPRRQTSSPATASPDVEPAPAAAQPYVEVAFDEDDLV